MSKQSDQTNPFQDTPAYYRREIEEQRELAEDLVKDMAFLANLFKLAYSKITSAVKSVRIGTFSTRDAA